MLDEFKKMQPLVYSLLTQSLKNRTYSHAYLFETNYHSRKMDFLMSFVKALVCPGNYTNFDNCKGCVICHRIDHNNFGDIKIIESDGLWIKKEQILNLQKEFSSCSTEATKRVYIIKNADRMNMMAANALLKFLEEPEENIIAILQTDNINKMLPTIISRCRILSLRPEPLQDKIKTADAISNETILKIHLMGYTLIEDDITEENIKPEEEFLKVILNYVEQIEKRKVKLIVDNASLWNCHMTDKNQLERAFCILILFYRDVLNCMLNKPIEIFDTYSDIIRNVKNDNTISSLTKKIKIVVETIESIRSNMNVSLMMDKFIIDMNGGIK